jgi:nucleoid-associated protein YgaU
MTATSMKLVVPLVALIVAGAVALVFGVQQLRREAPAEGKTAVAAPAKPASTAPAALAKTQAEVGALATALAGLPPMIQSDAGVPSFDIARIEPSGDAVIAGRAAPGATVELLRNGEVHDRAVADQAGQFAMVPRPLPSGTYDLTLRAKQSDGKQATSKQSVAVAIEPGRKDAPVVALMAPDKPTVVLSQPAASKPAAGTVVVEAVEIAPDGKFHVSGRARPGAAVRFYLNDSLIAPVTAGADGRLAVTINKGVAPGSYRVRLDEVEPNSGKVSARAEVPFNVPDTVVTASVQAQATADKRADAAPVQQPQLAAAATSAAADNKDSPSAVVVPKIATTTVSRGDSLWRISQSNYGAGVRYAIIYEANRNQIRNPNMIYPGQIFVLPTQ